MWKMLKLAIVLCSAFVFASTASAAPLANEVAEVRGRWQPAAHACAA